MANQQTPIVGIGWKAKDFRLPGVDGKFHSLADVKGPKGTVVMFICNHCPYVKAAIERIVRDVEALRAKGVGAVAIMSNDPDEYPEDSFENMQAVARRHRFPFPYVIDETQDIARAYGAVCTPDFLGFNADLELQYHGRLDASGRDPAPAGARRELFEAMSAIAETGKDPREQVQSIGCSIKWRKE